MPDDFQTKMRIQYALKERDVRIACLIVEGFKNLMDMIDEQSPSVLEALLEYGQDTRDKAPKRRVPVRLAIREYAEQALVEARRSERLLYYGITGRPEIEDEK